MLRVGLDVADSAVSASAGGLTHGAFEHRMAEVCSDNGHSPQGRPIVCEGQVAGAGAEIEDRVGPDLLEDANGRPFGELRKPRERGVQLRRGRREVHRRPVEAVERRARRLPTGSDRLQPFEKPLLTDLGVFSIDKHGDGGAKLIELADGVTVDEIKGKTEANFAVGV